MVTLALEQVLVVGDAGGPVLDGVDLTCPSGDLTVLIGPTGAGTTTVLRVLAGTQRADEGRVSFGCDDATRWRPGQRNVAVVDQQATVFTHLSVERNVAAALDALRLPRDEVERRVHAELRAVGLAGRARARPSRLSAGDRQRLAIARALVRRPAAFLLDDPFDAVDVHERSRLRAELRQLQQSLGITTVLATHQPGEALALADHLVILDDGRVAQAGTAQGCYDEPATTLVAELLSPRGIALVDVIVDADHLRLGAHALAQRVLAGPRVHHALPDGATAILALRPEALHPIEGGGPAGPAEAPRVVGSIVRARGVGTEREVVARLEPQGPDVRVTAAEGLAEGDGVLLEVDRAKALLFDIEGRLLTPLA